MSQTSNDSISLSQARSCYLGDDAGGTSPRRAGRHSSMGDLEITADSVHSNNGSPMMTPTSTKAIVDDAAELSLDNRNSGAGPSKSSTQTLCDGKRPTATISDDGEGGHSPRIPPACHQSPTEVRVHVDYGSSLSHDPVREGIKLGNSIVIGSDGGRRGRGTSWRHGEGGL